MSDDLSHSNPRSGPEPHPDRPDAQGARERYPAPYTNSPGDMLRYEHMCDELDAQAVELTALRRQIAWLIDEFVTDARYSSDMTGSEYHIADNARESLRRFHREFPAAVVYRNRTGDDRGPDQLHFCRACNGWYGVPHTNSHCQKRRAADPTFGRDRNCACAFCRQANGKPIEGTHGFITTEPKWLPVPDPKETQS